MIRLSIVTPCSRPDNLSAVAKSIKNHSNGLPFDVDWYIMFDGSVVEAEIYELTVESLQPYKAYINIITDLIANKKSIVGNAQRNHALDQITEGFVYFLDDDNLLHHNCLPMVNKVFKDHKYDKSIICSQLDSEDQRRNIGAKFTKPGSIDSAQYVVSNYQIGPRRWSLHNYAADGLFIQDIFKQHGQKVVFIDKINCFYNALCVDSALEAKHGPLIRVGNIVKVSKDYLSEMKRRPPSRQLRATISVISMIQGEEVEVCLTGDFTKGEFLANLVPIDTKHRKFNKGKGINVVFECLEDLLGCLDRDAIFGGDRGYPGKIHIGPQWSSNNHRSGWGYATGAFNCLHSREGVLLDGFIESSFSWNREFMSSSGKIPFRGPWVGFIHNPPNMPDWFGDGKSSNQQIFSQKDWQASIGHCKGLFTLSEYHKKDLKKIYPNLPVVSLFHPTEEPEVKFDFDRYLANKDKKLVQVGWWLRRPFSLHQITTKLIRATLNTNNPWQHLMTTHLKIPTGTDLSCVMELPFQPNDDYDQLLSQNVVFLDLIDSSANNAIIECIVRNTPVLVNRLDPVVEYLGEDYPLYFNSLEEAGAKADNNDLIYSAHKYLESSSIKEKLTKEYFLDSFVNSSIYRNL